GARAAPERAVGVQADAPDHGELQSGRFDLLLESRQPRPRPGLAHGHVVQRAYGAGDAGDLSDGGERDRVRRAEPAKAGDHVRSSSSTSPTLARQKSPGTVSLSALAATANSSACAGRSYPSSRAMSAAATLSPPHTRS